MMRMTYASFMQFYENVDISMLRGIWSPWRNKKGATAMKRKMMPRQHICSGSSRRYRCKRRRADERNMQDGGVIPTTGFPRDGGMAKEGHRMRQFDHGANTSISYNTCIRSTGDHLGIIPSKRAFRSGSSSTKEVVVHGP